MECREVWAEQDLEEIYALRYAVYVEEMGRPQCHADHRRRRLAEPLDRDAIHVAAYRGLDPCGTTAPGERGSLVGALRILLPDRGDLSELAWLHPGAAAPGAVRTGIVSRLVTAPDARGGVDSPGLQLSIAAYRIALREGLEAVEIDCHVSLVGFFEWLGFDVLRRFHHESYGDVAVMRIDPFDRRRLVATDSPLIPILDEGAERPSTDDPAVFASPGRTAQA